MSAALRAIPSGIRDTVDMSPFDAFIVSVSAADCLGVPHDGAILALLADDAAAEAFGSLDIDELMSVREVKKNEATSDSLRET